MEHWRVRGIEFVGSESFPRSKNVGWCTTLQHRADLYRRRVSPQQQMGVSRFNKKGVLHFSSWMVWFKVQRVKVVPNHPAREMQDTFLAGWSGSKFNASKLYHSDSNSGPSAISHPIPI